MKSPSREERSHERSLDLGAPDGPSDRSDWEDITRETLMRRRTVWRDRVQGRLNVTFTLDGACWKVEVRFLDTQVGTSMPPATMDEAGEAKWSGKYTDELRQALLSRRKPVC